ncbi:MAG: 2Fe-2S iron-sulfur cluster binding domain-containing protein, partial [Acidimicrobiia bacterium]|nr:2Fe-2S iron-sulfur cluster binding domain-containing protein [Acidimicrobiia bacterium]
MMSTIALGVSMFTGVILALVAVMLAARRRLVASGPVSIVVNDDESKTITTAAGGTLLSTLAAERIFIPSACGGKGTCGVCKAVVLEGGGTLLPTERTHVSRAEARRGVRLTCQVKVKQDLRIEVEPEIFSARQWQCTVRSNDNVATFIKELVLELPEGESVPFRAGGYVQTQCPPHEVR